MCRQARRADDGIGHQNDELLCHKPAHAAERQREAVPEEPEEQRVDVLQVISEPLLRCNDACWNFRHFDIQSTARTLGNQLLDGSVCLSSLCPNVSNALHVSTATPQGFLLTLRSLLNHSLPSVGSCQEKNTRHICYHESSRAQQDSEWNCLGGKQATVASG